MKKMIVPLVLVVLTVSVSYLFWQNFRLNEKVDAMQQQSVSITPVNPSTSANPAGVSEFDKPNVDPLASQFPPSQPAAEATSIKFDKALHDFGKINEGELVRTTFRFTNTGKNPLIISNAVGSCGCTVPKWPQHPVPPGGMDEIAVEFNSAGKRGENDKTVTVTANTTPANNTLTIRATVVPNDK
jgi:hypothetical protein